MSTLTTSAPVVPATADRAVSRGWRVLLFVLLVAIVGGVVGACCGAMAGGMYGFTNLLPRTSNPPVYVFLRHGGLQLGAFFGAVVALGYCRRMLYVLREAGFRVTSADLKAVGMRLGLFFSVVATLLLHGSLWVVAAFVATHKPNLNTSELIILGLAFGAIAGAIIGRACAGLCRRILPVEIMNEQAASGHQAPAALRIRFCLALLIAVVISALAGVTGCFFGGLATIGYRTMYQAHAWGFAINNSPAFTKEHGGHDLVEAISDRPFFMLLGPDAGFGGGLIVAGWWSWIVLGRNGCVRRGVDSALAIVLGIVAGAASTGILHAVLAETVRLDSSRPGPVGSMLGGGLFFGVPAGALVGAIGAALLAIASRKPNPAAPSSPNGGQ